MPLFNPLLGQWLGCFFLKVAPDSPLVLPFLTGGNEASRTLTALLWLTSLSPDAYRSVPLAPASFHCSFPYPLFSELFLFLAQLMIESWLFLVPLF